MSPALGMQRSDKALIVVAISVVAAIYVASQWVRGVRRGLDAVLERQHYPAGLSRDLRDALALVLLFSAAMLLQFAGGPDRDEYVRGRFPPPAGRRLPARGDRRDVRLRLHLRGRRRAAAPAAHRAWGGLGRDHAPLVRRDVGFRVFAERWPGYATTTACSPRRSLG